MITLSKLQSTFIQLPATRLARTTNVIRINFMVVLLSSACTANPLYLTLFTLSYNLLFVKQIKNIISFSICMLLLYRILDVVRFKSVKSYVDIQYSGYAVVIPGALESCYLKSLIFRGFRFNCDLLPLIERTPCI